MARKTHPQVVEKKLGRQNRFGQADVEGRIIEVDPRQDAYEYLDTIIHEWLHIEFPTWSEKTVTAKSKKLSKFLWKNKVRIIK